MNSVEFLTELWGAEPQGRILLWELATKRSRYLTSPAGATMVRPGEPDVYTGVALAHADHGSHRRTPNEKTIGIAGFWADIDINGGPDQKQGAAETLNDAVHIANLLAQPTILVKSGYGLQAWWLFTGGSWRFRTYGDQRLAARGSAQWQKLLRDTAETGLDYTHDLARILRLPGTTNSKGNQRAPVDVIDVGPRHDRDDLLETAARAGDVEPGYQIGEQHHVSVSCRPDATAERLDWLIARSPKFARTWRHERDELPSMSEHDMAIASTAALAGCSDQQIADLIVHHRTIRDPADEKARRVDYITRTILKARASEPDHEPEPARAAGKRGSHDPQAWAQIIRDQLNAPDDTAVPLPFASLTRALDGGLRPGDVCLVAGYTSHGKSLLVDAIADTAAADSKRVHLYMTEMTAYQRGLRLLARRTRVPFRTLKQRDLTPQQWREVNAELDLLPYGCSVVADWTVDEVVEHIATNHWDLAVVDLIHGFHYQDERDLSRTSSAIVRAAKSSASGDHHGTAIVCAAHLNDGQMRDQRSARRPKPGLHSIKGASSLKQDADLVLFVWQEDDDDGIPTGVGSVWIGKSRQGGFGAVSVKLDATRMTFMEQTALSVVKDTA